tara:strand:+ start:313 stop:570 length:258 start_codon:yes stop_codon:yes gene_type:complete
MKDTNKTLILNLFFEYGISVNANAYNTSKPEHMDSLREIVRKDAYRFLGTLGHVFQSDADELVKSFWNKALKEGLHNACKKGWRD